MNPDPDVCSQLETPMSGDFAGARWWKFDFHTHTPVSEDYGKGPDQNRLRQISPEDWLLGFMRAGVDCVAVTDHNSGAWIDKLQDAYEMMEKKMSEGFRPLHLFPGVEITVSGGIHLLAILGPGCKEQNINALLGDAGIQNADLGKINAITTKSLIDVVAVVHDAGGLAIPAHADCEKGIFEAQSGKTLEQTLRCEHIIAAEVLDKKQIETEVVRQHWNGWTCVLGSDSHHPSGTPGQSFPGSRFTWVKMGTPCIEGVKLALIDGEPLSVRRSDETDHNPNKQAPYVIESIKIHKAYLMGCRDHLEARFSPWMSALIGGRGTGKSTIVEMLRLALRRDRELPEELVKDFNRFNAVPESRNDDGALREDTEVVANIIKGGKQFCVRWRQDGTKPSIEELSANGHWDEAPGVVEQRFPVRIFSQKQVLSLARDPNALLRLIDDDPTVDWYAWHSDHRQLEAQYLSLRSQAREVVAGLAGRKRLEGELAEIRSKLEIFETSGHRELLTSYQRIRRQARVIHDRSAELKENEETLLSCSAQVEPSNIPDDEFDFDVPEETEVHQLLLEAQQKQREFSRKIATMAAEISGFRADWMRRIESSIWKKAERKAQKSYQALSDQLQEQGVGDPTSFGALVQRRQALEAALRELDAAVLRKVQLDEKASAVLDQIERSRLELSEKRARFLAQVTGNSNFIRVTPIPWGSRLDLVEVSFRKVVNKTDARLADDFLSDDETKGVLPDLYYGLSEVIELRTQELSERIRKLKSDLDGVCKGATLESRSKWFHNHIRDLTDEELDRLHLWWPEDSLKVEYSRDGRKFVPIEQGSPGQKSAAILAFLLSYGDEPLILDQPEDDLDNHLIYDLIVQQIRENKQRRQVIVVTHNPNIVVNGDAEQVIEMDHRCGQCVVVESGTGCLQDSGVREAICNIMEGGQRAFQSRYRRLVN